MATDDMNYVYEWQGLAEKWINSEESFDNDFPSQPYYDEEGRVNKPVSAWVVEDVFNLTLQKGSADIGSKLPGYDIKSRDAYEMIRLSLTAEMAGNPSRFYECYADENGKVGFYPIGVNNSNITYLYSINSGQVNLKCDNVMVIGYDPPPKKYTGNEYDLFTFTNTYKDILDKYEETPVPDADPYDKQVDNFISDPYLFVDEDRGLYPKYHIFGDMLSPEMCDYFIEGFIEYGNPMFTNVAAMAEIGVYDYTKFESVVGYIYKITVDFYEEGMTSVQFSSRTNRFQILSGFGELQTRKPVSNDIYVSSLCKNVIGGVYGREEPDDSVGIYLPLSERRKFLGVKDIYIYGYKVKLRPFEIARPNTDPTKDKEYIWERDASCDFWAVLDTMQCEPFRLSRDEDYVIVKKKGDDKDTKETSGYKAVFSCNLDEFWRDRFGKHIGVPYHCWFRIDPVSIVGHFDLDNNYIAPKFEFHEEGHSFTATGYLKDQRTNMGEVNSDTVYPATIFPIGEGNVGYVVEKIVAVYDWDNPSIVIKDQRPDKITLENLKPEHVNVKFYPIIIKDDPAPIALNGELLNPIEVMPDYDPTTTQNLEETTYARAFSSLESGDIKVTMPFADADDCIQISNLIKSIQNDVSEEIVYICKPGTEPVLGEKYGGGVINAIDYSYQDSSQYLISVHVGPMWRGVGSWDTSIYKMKTENTQLEGKVVQVSKDDVKCRVFLKNIGILECINGTKNKLEKGDFVSVTVYNNPVSL